MKYVILVLLTVSFAFGQPGPFGGGKGMGGQGICGMENKLELNADQQKKVETFRSDMQKKQIDLMAKVKTMRVELRDLYNNENPDQKAIESKITEIGKLQNDMKLNHTNFWFAVNKILTADQQKIWKESGRIDCAGSGDGRQERMGRAGGRGERFEGRNHRNCDGSCR
jgi:Spy/CpxP family protein refolding chaperone